MADRSVISDSMPFIWTFGCRCPLTLPPEVSWHVLLFHIDESTKPRSQLQIPWQRSQPTSSVMETQWTGQTTSLTSKPVARVNDYCEQWILTMQLDGQAYERMRHTVVHFGPTDRAERRLDRANIIYESGQ